MRIDIATLFPEMVETVLKSSITGRALASNKFELHCHNIRDFSDNKHRHVDDTPYGGGMGMVMSAEPIYRCFESVASEIGEKPYVYYMSPQGRVLNQTVISETLLKDNIFILCGHYEGVDQRVIDLIVDCEVSIGDYVLTGGEIPALAFVDSVVRQIDGVLSDKSCFEGDSHFDGYLEHPQYTKPAIWREMEVPAVLLSGNHAKIDIFRKNEKIRVTQEKRPDLLEK